MLRTRFDDRYRVVIGSVRKAAGAFWAVGPDGHRIVGPLERAIGTAGAVEPVQRRHVLLGEREQWLHTVTFLRAQITDLARIHTGWRVPRHGEPERAVHVLASPERVAVGVGIRSLGATGN